MVDKSIVYWASPIEIPSLQNTAVNMVTNNLVKTRLILDKILDHINPGDKVGVKVHVGEALNTRYVRPDYVREVVKAIKAKGGVPTLIETQGLGEHVHNININEEYKIGVMHRRNAVDHLKIAHLHGYTESITGAPLEFIDGAKGIERKIIKIEGIQFKEVSVAKNLFEYDKFVVISHFKGHAFAGFGGALKQLGIGCVSKHNKHLAHFNKGVIVNIKKCNPSLCKQECVDACPVGALKVEGDSAIINASMCYGCFKCIQKCPIKRAIKGPSVNPINVFIERYIDNAMAVVKYGPEKFRYLNIAIDIPVQCDCVSNASVPIIPDLGIYGSSDPVAVDKACIDAETAAPGLPFLNKEEEWTKPIEKGIEKFKAFNPTLDIPLAFETAVKNKLGNINYELVKI